MARYIELYDPKFECHKDIGRLVKSRIKPEIVVQTVCSRRSYGPMGEHRAYIDIIPCSAPVPGLDKTRLCNSVGIPLHALVPEKVAPIAYWLLKEFKIRRPDLFQEGNVTLL